MSELPSWAVAGQKVICIDDGTEIELEWDCDLDSPAVGEIVTIDRAYVDGDGVPILWFEEYAEAECPATDYRPLVTRTQEQDVAAIRKLVDDMPQETRVDLIGELL